MGKRKKRKPDPVAAAAREAHESRERARSRVRKLRRGKRPAPIDPEAGRNERRAAHHASALAEAARNALTPLSPRPDGLNEGERSATDG